MSQPEPLIDLYRLHSEEVRFQVQLNWDRAKSSLTFHVALLALTAGLDSRMARGFTVGMFAFVAGSALLGARILQVSHGYYRAARDRRAEIEAKLGTAYGFVTTPGMSKTARHWPNVTQILVGLHLLLAALAVIGAVVYGMRWR